ncbi:hypothetical protein MF672_031135 [Actinomadura sp. ATCC 31491]|uniref:MarR family transcriptional regulator n=1 Tax=Actinomadura luzonensis TaxID=2805427 RepID=A0ABT0G0X1_9ACTN|nr:hypothetical protein [Actinomadura luzonensis]MCK2218212.1 hypothetical protein [Actinomadura luzonensis]
MTAETLDSPPPDQDPWGRSAGHVLLTTVDELRDRASTMVVRLGLTASG